MVRLEKVRHLALDLDGTLLDADKQVPEVNAAAIKGLQARFSWRIWLVSARMPPSILKYRDQLPGLAGDLAGMVAFNGAWWSNFRAGTSGMTALDRKTASLIWARALSRQDLFGAWYSGQDWQASNDGAWLERELWSNGIPPALISTEIPVFGTPPLKLMFRGPVRSLNWLKCEIAPIAAIATTSNRPNILEITSRGVSKAAGLMAALGRTREPESRTPPFNLPDVLAVGDGENDVDLLRAAGIAVAMKNAARSCLEIADLIAGHHDRDGLRPLAKALLRQVSPRG